MNRSRGIFLLNIILYGIINLLVKKIPSGRAERIKK